MKTHTPLFEAIDGALLEVGQQDAKIARIAELLASLDARWVARLETVLERRMQLEAVADKLRVLKELVEYHHRAALHYTRLQHQFTVSPPVPQQQYSLAEVNGMFARHHRERAQELAQAIRQGGVLGE